MERNRINAANSAIIGIYNLLLLVTFICAFHIFQSILVPLATAAILTFLFSPLISYLELLLGRIISISIIVCLLFISAGLIGYTLSKQVINFSDDLPKYSENIRNKLYQLDSLSIFGSLSNTIEDLSINNHEDLNTSKNNTSLDNNKKINNTNSEPVSVKIINDIPSTTFYTLIFGSIFTFLAYTLLVMILVFFMLYYREDLRGRILRVIGIRQISTATEAIEDVGDRVSKYLLSLFIVNAFYGLFVMLALSIIGIPNAPLWGIMGAILRFVPYIGFAFSAFFPIILSLIISTDFLIFLETILFYLVIELIINYLVEPIFYGNRTGISPLALIIAAIFWTWLWGFMGLVLAVPLTVCLVVIGKHIPKLKLLSVIFEDTVSSSQIYEDLYYRIITGEFNDVIIFINHYIKDHSIIELYDNIIIPIIVNAEKDYHKEILTAEQREWLYQTINDINELYITKNNFTEKYDSSHNKCKLICLGARTESDQLTNLILTQILTHLAFNVSQITSREEIANLSTILQQESPRLVCISALSLRSIIHAKYLCNTIKTTFNKTQIIVCLWDKTILKEDEIANLKSIGEIEVVTSIDEAIHRIKNSCPDKV